MIGGINLVSFLPSVCLSVLSVVLSPERQRHSGEVSPVWFCGELLVLVLHVSAALYFCSSRPLTPTEPFFKLQLPDFYTETTQDLFNQTVIDDQRQIRCDF